MVDFLVICMMEESEILCSFVEPLLNCHSCLIHMHISKTQLDSSELFQVMGNVLE